MTVHVDDSSNQGSAAKRSLTVEVLNIDEDGTVQFNTNQPKVGSSAPLTATLLDDDEQPDGGTGNDLSGNASTTWQWARSTSRSGGWIDIVATTSANLEIDGNTRTLEEADVGYYLRATATYTDGHSEDKEDTKTAHAVTANKVAAENYANTPPVFEDDEGNATTTRTIMVVENLAPGSAVGAPVSAIDEGQYGRQEVLTYSLHNKVGTTGCANTNDCASFDINSATGQILVGSGTENLLDYEDSNKNSYTVVVRAADPSDSNATDTTKTRAEITVTIEVTDVKEAPKFGDVSTDPDKNITATSTPENAVALVATYTATDDEDDNANPSSIDVEWSLSGADMDQFTTATTSSNDLELSLKSSDYENPADSGGNNVYNVTVNATDSDGQTSSLGVAITVTNVEEPGTVTLSHPQPEVGTAIWATLTDPDGGVRGASWQWAQCDTENCSNPTTISGATGSTFTPSQDAKFLQATVTYTDRATSVVDSSDPSDGSAEVETAVGTSIKEVRAVKDPNNAAPTLPDTAQTRSIDENSGAGTAVGAPIEASDIDGGDVLLYTLRGSDAGLFTIGQGQKATGDAEGQIYVGKDTKLDYESRTSYSVTVTATDSALASDRVSVTIEVEDVDEAPFVSKRGVYVSGPASVSYDENGTDEVTTYTATGADASGASLMLSGDDAGAFSLSGGALRFLSSPDFENPTDAGMDNVYNVIVTASKGSLSSTRAVAITVVNVDEPGTVTLSPETQLRVGAEIMAELTGDEDGDPTGVTWRWARASATNGGAWSNIAGATAATYTPVEADMGYYLRATAMYTDPQGSGKSAEAATSDPVLDPSMTPNDGSVSLSPDQPVVGTAVEATLTDPDGDPDSANVMWAWAWSAASADGSWMDISGAMSASYTPVDDDAGGYLRATATYTDVDGPDQTASMVTGPVALHAYDSNVNGLIDRAEVIAAINDYLFNQMLDRDEAIVVIKLYLFHGIGD